MTVDDVCSKHFYNGLHRKAYWATYCWPMVVLSRVVTWRHLLARSIKEEEYESYSDVMKKEEELLAKQRGNSKVYENGEVSSTRI